jgi:pimeloyl-ACP methyl ester carboxylesterase
MSLIIIGLASMQDENQINFSQDVNQCLLKEGYLSYQKKGKGQKVLLVMGFMARGRAWHRQLEALSEHYEVVCYDHRGIGDSSTNPASSMADLAQDALDLMDHLQWEKAHIVGISMGGMIAQYIATLAQARCLSLTLIATHAGGFEKGITRVLPKWSGLPLFLKAQFSKSPAHRFLALSHLLLTKDFLQNQGILNRSLDEIQDLQAWQDICARLSDDFTPKPPFKTRFAHIRAIFKHHQKDLHTLQIPTLIIQPKEDLLVNPKHSDDLKKKIPHAKFISVKAGHGVIREIPQEINQALFDHFKSIETSDA